MTIGTHYVRSMMSSPFFLSLFLAILLNNTYHKLPAPLHNGGVACVVVVVVFTVQCDGQSWLVLTLHFFLFLFFFGFPSFFTS